MTSVCFRLFPLIASWPPPNSSSPNMPGSKKNTLTPRKPAKKVLARFSPVKPPGRDQLSSLAKARQLPHLLPVSSMSAKPKKSQIPWGNGTCTSQEDGHFCCKRNAHSRIIHMRNKIMMTFFLELSGGQLVESIRLLLDRKWENS